MDAKATEKKKYLFLEQPSIPQNPTTKSWYTMDHWTMQGKPSRKKVKVKDRGTSGICDWTSTEKED